MNIVSRPVRVLENKDGTMTIMVPHQPGQYGQANKEAADNTREFCNWIRKNLTDVPTEFRYMQQQRVRDYKYRYWHRYKTINTDKCFVAYSISRNDMMRLRLAWTYSVVKTELSGKDSYETGVFVLDHDSEPTPSNSLKARWEKGKPKPVKL